MATAAARWAWAEVPPLPLSGMVTALLLLNLVDALLTITWVELDLAREANPLMALMLQGSPVLFMISKMLLVQAGTLVLVRNRDCKPARVALAGGCVLYVLIVAWHASFLAQTVVV